MQIFEDSIRSRRRAARLNAQRRKKVNNSATAMKLKKKREISSEERFRRARELISKNYSTNQISKILRISERSVTRFKKRIREEKRKLRAEGKIQDDEGNSFKYLSISEKVKRAKELFEKNLKIQEISDILRVSERTVRRWKDRLTKMEDDTSIIDVNMQDEEKIKTETDYESNNIIEQGALEDDEIKPKRKRRAYLDREKVQYATELVENGLSNKDMSMLLEMSIACVRKLKMKILNGTVEELIDDSEEHYKNLNNNLNKEVGNDPLNVLPELRMPNSSQKASCERRQKANLSDRDMLIVRLLRDNQMRTMDIAKIIGISERSVTRLLSKTKDLLEINYDPDIVEEVDRLLASKDEILNNEANIEDLDINTAADSKQNIALSLLAMNVAIKDISKMLDVPEKIVHKWKANMIKEEDLKDMMYEDSQNFSKIQPKEEYIVTEYLE